MAFLRLLNAVGLKTEVQAVLMLFCCWFFYFAQHGGCPCYCIWDLIPFLGLACAGENVPLHIHFVFTMVCSREPVPFAGACNVLLVSSLSCAFLIYTFLIFDKKKMVILFANTFQSIYYEHLMGSSAQYFYKVIRIAKRIAQAIKMKKKMEVLPWILEQ
jgi:hypothetical protein